MEIHYLLRVVIDLSCDIKIMLGASIYCVKYFELSHFLYLLLVIENISFSAPEKSLPQLCAYLRKFIVIYFFNCYAFLDFKEA